MRTSSIATVLAVAATGFAREGPVEIGIAPKGSPPSGCELTVDGNFTIGILNLGTANSKRETAVEASSDALAVSLNEGILIDPLGRIGSIVANYQFQFDGPPPQAGAIYTGGFSRCDNGSLAIGSSTRWWRCMSGAFGNLYDRWIGDQCTEVRIVASMVDSDSSSSRSSSSSTQTGSSTSPTGTAVVTTGSSNSTTVTSTSTSSPTGLGTGGSSPPSESSPTSEPEAPPAGGSAATVTVASGTWQFMLIIAPILISIFC